MDFPISDGVVERLAEYLECVGSYLCDCRQRASFALYTLGLLSDLPRKSVEPIAELFCADLQVTNAAHQRLLHFLCNAPWPDDELRVVAAHHALSQMIRHSPMQTLIIDDTSSVKCGAHSVGVQRQYCGALGKIANCQVVVSLTVGTVHSHMPIDMQPYLPRKWLDSPALRREARIPEAAPFLTKPPLAVQMLRRARHLGVSAEVVLADAAYGDGADFRHDFRQLGLHYAVGIQFATTVQLVRNDLETISGQALLERLPASIFRRYSWREGTGRKLSARFAFFPVRSPNSDDPETLWLILGRRDGAVRENRAYLSSTKFLLSGRVSC